MDEDNNDGIVLPIEDIRRLIGKRESNSDRIRSIYWKILLRYLPCDSKKWSTTLESRREDYDEMMSHVLENLDTDKDTSLMDQIHKDAIRTLHTVDFLQEPISWQEHLPEKAARGQEIFFLLKKNSQDGGKARTRILNWHVFEKILFLYSKVAFGYVQGMNEILAPIYYVLSRTENEWAEEDAFFCFSGLMAEIRDHYLVSMDSDAGSGILCTMQKVMIIIRLEDPQLFDLLEGERVFPACYIFRWITILFSQEFELEDVLVLWDALFADENRFRLVLYTCASLLILLRDHLLRVRSFAEILRLLQTMPRETDVREVIALAKTLADKFGVGDFPLITRRLGPNATLLEISLAVEQRHLPFQEPISRKSKKPGAVLKAFFRPRLGKSHRRRHTTR